MPPPTWTYHYLIVWKKIELGMEQTTKEKFNCLSVLHVVGDIIGPTKAVVVVWFEP